MRRMVLALSLAWLMTAAQSASADESAKQNDIRRLMKLSGSGDLGIQVMQQLIESLKKAMPNVPEPFWSGFVKEVRPDELIEQIVPVYDRNLSHDDIKDLIRFYESPIGRKFVSVLPKITQESMKAGQVWGRDVAQRALKKLASQPQP